jgi:hypothetical protein
LSLYRRRQKCFGRPLQLWSLDWTRKEEGVGNVNFSQIDTPEFWSWTFCNISWNRKFPKRFDRGKRNL